jgi:hypothetical protein
MLCALINASPPSSINYLIVVCRCRCCRCPAVVPCHRRPKKGVVLLMLKQYSLHWIAKNTLSFEIILKLWLHSKLPRIVSNPLLILCGIPWTSCGIPWTSLGGILCGILCGILRTNLGSVRLVMGPMWLVTHMWGSLLMDALVAGSVVWFVAWLSVWHVNQHTPAMKQQSWLVGPSISKLVGQC